MYSIPAVGAAFSAVSAPPLPTARVPGRVALISPSGWGNLGDAAIIDALIQGLRRRIPAVEIVGFTLNPEDTSQRHGIEAHPCLGYSLPGYHVKLDGGWDDTGASESRATRSALVYGKVRRGAGRVPAFGRALEWASYARAEQRSYRRALARIRGFSHVVIAGGGQLDDFWGGPWGHPYTLWRWSRLARAAGASYLVLSVGTGSLDPVLSRALVGRALAAAAYRSFRDDGSRELLTRPSLTDGDPTVPDLAYSLTPPPEATAVRPPRQRVVFGLSPMSYGDPRVWPVKRPELYERHVTDTANLAQRVLARGDEVVLFATSGSDRRTVAEVMARVRGSGAPASALERLRAPEADGVDQLMFLLASVDVVVASRLHAVLLSHVMARPVLAVSHERKVNVLMEGMGQAPDRLDLPAYEPSEGWRRLMEVSDRRVELSADIARRVAGYREQVDAQYDQVFGPLLAGDAS